jgi:hypothetical protein
MNTIALNLRTNDSAAGSRLVTLTPGKPGAM